MNASTVTVSQAGAPWLLLIHQLPPKPDYLRAKIRRRLDQIGALPLKNSVYVIPRTEDTAEDVRWIAREIAVGRGEATVCEAAFVAGVTDVELRALFRGARDRDYTELAKAARTLRSELRSTRSPDGGARATRLRRRLSDVIALDFFGAAGRRAAEQAVATLETHVPTHPTLKTVRGKPRARTWVTRAGVKVDRIASAWLIQRFIDPAAQLRFVPEKGYAPRAGELRFDMYDAEYTHEGDRCTFETLLTRFALKGRPLRAIADIVHDIDCKDERFGRPETPGIATVIHGIAAGTDDDLERIARGTPILDALYTHFGGS